MKPFLFALGLFLASLPCLAGQEEADAAVAGILFAQDMENVSYTVRRGGYVDILFGAAVSDADYSRLLELLRNHPDIAGVLAGRGNTNYCPIK